MANQTPDVKVSQTHNTDDMNLSVRSGSVVSYCERIGLSAKENYLFGYVGDEITVSIGPLEEYTTDVEKFLERINNGKDATLHTV